MLTAWQLQRASQSFKNTTSDTIPPYACMELDYFNESGISANEIITDTQNLFWRIKKPTSSAVTDPGRVVFNGPTQVGPNGYGEFQVSGLLLAAFDSVDGMPAAGGKVAPKDGSWYVTTGDEVFPFVSYDSGRALYESADKRSIWIRAAGGTGGTGATKMIGTMKEAWSGGIAECDIKSIDGITITDTGIDADVYDPLGVFSLLSTGDSLYITKQGGKYYAADNAPCPAE